MCINPIGETYKIWTIHQYAGRLFRKDVAQAMSKFIPELEQLEVEQLMEIIEEDANFVEKQFLKVASEQGGEKVPVFDFEIN